MLTMYDADTYCGMLAPTNNSSKRTVYFASMNPSVLIWLPRWHRKKQESMCVDLVFLLYIAL